MLETILTFATSAILLLLSMLHFYWAFGGSWGIEYTIPEKFKDRFFNEKYKWHTKLATIIVAIGLLVFAVIIFSNHYDFTGLLKPSWTRTLTQVIGVIFIARAIGDFNIVGIFKKSKESIFEKKDSQIYVPLCIYLGLSTLFISF